MKVGDQITVGFAGSRFTEPGWRAQVREGQLATKVNSGEDDRP